MMPVERAERVTRAPEATRPADQGQYLIFRLGGEAFAIGILRIKEIIEYGHVTEIPLMPGVIRGVINLRGAVVPVIDLAARFGRKRAEPTRRTCIVIIEVRADDETHEVGVVVDSVRAVQEIADQDIEPAPAFGTKLRADFIQSMAKVDGKFVIILDVDRVFSAEEIALVKSDRLENAASAANGAEA